MADAATRPGAALALVPGGAEERAALDRVPLLFADFTTSNVTARERNVYAPDAYLGDGFKELRGLDEIAPYMIRSAEAQRRCTFVFEDTVARDGEYYLR
ncbi:MAG: hypothetical protein O3B24_08165 [Verrucomicrobia bacterium]|nr:hypothetical protein [Verrucomicrobiota bacterium]